MWLNIPRVRGQQAAAMADGLALSSSETRIDPAMADAIALVEEEADELAYRANAARADARARAKHGFGQEG
jgi:hypothetical protein